jgi:hypothetical protein
MADADAGLTTFVGRVRGRLDPADEAWVRSTSDAVSAVRLDLVSAAGRLQALEAAVAGREGRSLAGSTPTGVGDASSGEREADESGPWAGLVNWATAVNAALVELAGRRRLPASLDVTATAAIAAEQVLHAATDRSLELGALLQELRGEQVVDELLTAGVLVAPPGTTASIPFAEHGAWDLEFLGSGGATIARADVRITSDPTELLSGVAARPGVDLVYTTSDAADGLADTEGVSVVRPGEVWPAEPAPLVVVDIGTDASALHADLVAALDAAGADATADAVLEAVPVLALLVVGTRAATRSATTQDPGSDIATATWRQTKDVITTAGVSELVGWASGMNVLKVPATLTFALGRAAVRDARASVSLSGRRVTRARRLISGSAPPASPSP